MLKNAFLLLLLAGSSFAWWDSSFPYRTQVNISNAGTTLTDYQVNISLNTQALIAAGKMRSDCADLRAVAANDSSQLPFWIETGCNTIATRIWVKFPAIASGANTAHLYYGNSIAAYNNSLGGNSTFDFFDDFSGDLSKWTIESGGWVIQNGKLHLYAPNAEAWKSILANNLSFADAIIEYDWSMTGSYAVAMTALGWNARISGSNSVIGYDYEGQNQYKTVYSPGGSEQIASYSYTMGTTYYERIALNGSSISIYLGTSPANMPLFYSPTASTITNAGSFKLFALRSTSDYDNVRVRKYASPEPTTSTLAEQEAIEFAYRKEIQLNNAGSLLSDYQVTLTIDTAALIAAGKMRSDCGDLRFTNSTIYSTQNWAASYPYWIESGCNTTATKIWVKVPSIPAGTSTIYAYYGNASALSASNGNNTFIQYHGFSTATFYEPFIIPYTANVTFEVSGRRIGTGENVMWGLMDSSNVPTYDGFHFQMVASPRLYFRSFVNNQVTAYGSYSDYNPLDGQYYRLKIARASPTSIKAYVDGVQYMSEITTITQDNLGLMMLIYGGAASQEWSFVRQYASPEPVASTLTEQEALQFAYGKEIQLNNAGSLLSDYQVNLTIDTAALIAAGKMKADCADVRVTNSTSYNTQDWAASYSYWIESGCNTGATKIWVKVPSIPNGTSTIFAYYGNASAVSASNGWNTFEFFDDFLGTFIDTSKWARGSAYGSTSVGNSLMTITGSSTNWEEQHSIPAFGTNYSVRYLFNVNAENDHHQDGFGSLASGSTTMAGDLLMGATKVFRTNKAGATHDIIRTDNFANYNILEIIRNGSTNILYYVNDSLKGTESIQVPTVSMPVFFTRYSTGTIIVNWVFVRKYSSPEPTATEQQPDTTAPSVQIQSPISQTYPTVSVPVNFTATDNAGVSSCTVRLNGTINSSTCSNYTLTLSNGVYTLNVTANDTSGNENSEQVAFTVAVSQQAQLSSSPQVSTVSGIADGNVSFSFNPAFLRIRAGAQEYPVKTMRASAGVTKVQIRAKVTTSGQNAPDGTKVTYTLSE